MHKYVKIKQGRYKKWLQRYDVGRVKIEEKLVNNVTMKHHKLAYVTSQRNLLSLGLNFSRTSKVSVPDIVAPIEHSFKNSKISPDQ